MIAEARAALTPGADGEPPVFAALPGAEKVEGVAVRETTADGVRLLAVVVLLGIIFTGAPTNEDNVIVRNLTVSDSTDCFPEWDPSDTGAGNWNSRYDNISLRTSTHVWIDHNTLDSGAIPPSELETVYGRPY